MRFKFMSPSVSRFLTVIEIINQLSCDKNKAKRKRLVNDYNNLHHFI